ncbi:hypothetical protein FFWV33_06785 [Flavobacterium faecale]|uniref:Uncharacterized protein n=1 Tax=Flavobacterium faecale TaxID=1355330 RepID=A0A2S1LBX4_9FLAO|nr:hypothetical protein [Flavobacterium faecale]AWG21259.1 hypothetical protein FFWV33_06785 [Flavobacterium faecale]
MKKTLILLIFILNISCSNDSIKDENSSIIESPNKISLKINGLSTTEDISEISSFFSCDRDLNVTVTSKKNFVTDDLIVMNLTKEGTLKSVYFVDKSGHSRQDYYSPDFIPSSTITISEFEFIDNTKLKFKFSGQVFKKKHSLLEPNETITIEGTVQIKKFINSQCNTFVNYMTLNNDIKLSNISRINQNDQQNSIVSYEGTSLNGYNIVLKNIKQNLLEMPLGTYSFSNKMTNDKIEFRKYIGIPKSFSTTILIPTDWTLYETQGSFTITEKTTINGLQVVKLKLNFTATKNGTVEYKFTNSDFITAY